ncbi:MAG: hypothetical protein WCH79_14800 [Planctomycetia bacterium]
MPIDMPAAPLTAAAKGSWTGLLATAGLVFLGVILLGGAVVPWWLSEPSRVTAWVSRLVPNLHGRVEMAKATFTWLGPIAFEDVVVVPANGAREPVVIQRIEASHGIAAFLFTGGDVGHVTVEGLQTHLVFGEDRNSNAAGLFVDPSDPDEGHRPPRKTPLRMVLDIVDARVRIEGPWSPDPWISDPIDITLRLAHTPAGDASEWSLEPTTILEGAELEPSVAQGVLAYIAPVLADATRTSGRFSLALDGGTFPVGAPEKSMFSGKLTMHAVDLGPGPMVAGLLAALPGRIQVPTSIRIADNSQIAFQMEDRRMWHEGLEFGFPLPRGGGRLDLTSRGSVGLDDKVLDLKLALPFPADLPADRPILASLAGKTVSIGIGGKLGEPRIDFDGSIRGAAAGVIAATIDRLRTKPTAAPVLEPQPTTSAAPRQPAVSAPPRPGWAPGQAAGAAVAADGATNTAANGSEADAADGVGDQPEMLAPPSRPGWSPIKRPGVGPQAGQAFSKGDRGPAGSVPPAGFAAGDDARPLADGGEPPSEEQPTRGGAAQIIDGLKDRLAPQMADSPQTDRGIDLVGGLIEEVARRRAQRAAAEGAIGPQPGQGAPPAGAGAGSGAGGQGAQGDPAAAGAAGAGAPGAGPAGGGPRRGRLLRRLLQPEAPPSAPPTAPSPGP